MIPRPDFTTVRDFDSLSFLRDRGIKYWESGKNISRDWIGIQCLWCDDPSNHLGIHLEHGSINCYRCPVSGTVIKLVMKVDNCHYEQAIDILKQYNRFRGMHIKPHTPRRWTKHERVTTSRTSAGVLDQFRFDDNMLEVHENYLRDREFDPSFVTDFYGIKFCGPVGKYALRIIIPFYERGKAVTFTSRDVTDRSPIPYIHLENENALINMKDTLYNLENAQRHTVLVVEGAFDVWRIGNNCVATMGDKYTLAQLKILSKYRRVFVLYDAEEEAQQNAKNLCKDLSAAVSEAKVLELAEGDPAELSSNSVKDLRKQVFGQYF